MFSRASNQILRRSGIEQDEETEVIFQTEARLLLAIIHPSDDDELTSITSITLAPMGLFFLDTHNWP